MSELEQLTKVELVLLRHAIQDHGPGIWHNPMIASTLDNVGRYLAEGGRLLPDRDWRFVWRCVVQVLQSEPDLVTPTPPTQTGLAARRKARQHQADGLLDDALAAYQKSEWDTALDLIDRAELAAPGYRPRGRDYDDLRGFVRRAAAA